MYLEAMIQKYFRIVKEYFTKKLFLFKNKKKILPRYKIKIVFHLYLYLIFFDKQYYSATYSDALVPAILPEL